MTKQDIINNKHNFGLAICYGIVFAIVYGYWMYKEELPIWSYILVAVGFIAIGIAAGFIITALSVKKNKIEEKPSDEASPEIIQ